MSLKEKMRKSQVCAIPEEGYSWGYQCLLLSRESEISARPFVVISYIFFPLKMSTLNEQADEENC